MRETLIRLLLTALLLMACSSVTALADGGGDPPLCYPKACPGR